MSQRSRLVLQICVSPATYEWVEAGAIRNGLDMSHWLRLLLETAAREFPEKGIPRKTEYSAKELFGHIRFSPDEDLYGKLSSEAMMRDSSMGAVAKMRLRKSYGLSPKAEKEKHDVSEEVVDAVLAGVKAQAVAAKRGSDE